MFTGVTTILTITLTCNRACVLYLNDFFGAQTHCSMLHLVSFCSFALCKLASKVQMYSPHVHLRSSWTMIPRNQSPAVRELLNSLTKGMQNPAVSRQQHKYQDIVARQCITSRLKNHGRKLVFDLLLFFPCSLFCTKQEAVQVKEKWTSNHRCSQITFWILSPTVQAPFNTRQTHLNS